MKISKYLAYFLRDFFAACGCLIVINAIFLSLNSIKGINTSLLWQNVLAALAFTFFKFALVNKYELEKKVQRISFYICFLLADAMVLLWLLFFSPGKIMDINLIIIYIIIIIIVKVAVYAMMYIDGNSQARQLNKKLDEYKKTRNE